MLIDGRTVPDGTALQADVCIIGGGPVAIAMARAFAATSRQVVVLEGGGLAPDPANQAFFAGENVGEPVLSYDDELTLDQQRVRVLGGATRHWGGYCRPLLGIELEDRPWATTPGWSLWADDLATWYPVAHDLLALGPYDYDLGSWLTRIGTTFDAPPGPFLEVHVAQKRYRDFGSVFRAELSAAPDVTVYHSSNVTNLDASANGDHVDTVTVRTLAGTGFTVAATAVVLAAGGIENPRLLLASNDVVPAGLGNANDLVGRYYTDHLKGYGGFLASPVPKASLQLLSLGGYPLPSSAGGTFSLFGLLSPDEATMRSRALPSAHLELIASDLAYGPNQAVGLTDDQIAELLSAEGTPAQSAIGFTTLFEQVPDADSRVTLSTQLDPLGRPLARLDWRYGETDQQHLLELMSLAGRSLALAGWGRLQHVAGWVTVGEPTGGSGLDAVLTRFTVTPQADVPYPVPMGTGYHHMCTTRMATDPSQGVVDVDCRVHGIDNLWVAGSSVFPTGPGVYPTLTILALGLRLADHLHTAVLP